MARALLCRDSGGLGDPTTRSQRGGRHRGLRRSRLAPAHGRGFRRGGDHVTRSRCPPGSRAALRWTGLLLMVWAASGLPFDLLTAAGLVGHRTAAGEIVLSTVYWPALATRAFALAALIVLARLTLGQPAGPASTRPPAGRRRGVCARAALPRSPGPLGAGRDARATSPGGAGVGWEPLLIVIPWALAAVLSLLLASPPRRMPRRMVTGGGLVRHRHRRHDRPVRLLGLRRRTGQCGDMATGRSTSGSRSVDGSGFLWAIAVGPSPAPISCVARLEGCSRRHERALAVEPEAEPRADRLVRGPPVTAAAPRERRRPPRSRRGC